MGDSVRRSDDKIMQDHKDTKDRNITKEFTEDEEKLIARMFNLVGERWSLIAGRIPGRTAEEIRMYWTSKQTSSAQN